MKYTEMLWKSFQEEEEEQRAVMERHMSEGMILVKAAEDEKSQRELDIFEKSFNFVERDRQASAILILQRAVRLTALARAARARVKQRREMLARAGKGEAKAEHTAAAAPATDKHTAAAAPATDKVDAGPATEESPHHETLHLPPATRKQKNADAEAHAKTSPQVKKHEHVELPLITKKKKKNVPPPPAGKPKKKSAPAKQLSKLEIRQSLAKLNQKRQKLIRSLARALKTKGSDLHQLQRDLKGVSIEIQQLLAMQSRSLR